MTVGVLLSPGTRDLPSPGGVVRTWLWRDSKTKQVTTGGTTWLHHSNYLFMFLITSRQKPLTSWRKRQWGHEEKSAQ